MSVDQDHARQLRELEALVRIHERADAIGRRLDRAIRESDRRAEAYLPILRRAGLAPRRGSRWV